MAGDDPPSRAADEANGVILNNDDVLLGRGLGSSKYIGNKRFRDLVATRKAEYTAEDSYNEKAVIAKEVFAEIKSRGGRFLTLASLDTKKPSRSVVEKGIWMETDVESALEKCKQALREKPAPREEGGVKRKNHEENERSDCSQTTFRLESQVPPPAVSHLHLTCPASLSRSPFLWSGCPFGATMPSLVQPTALLGNPVPSGADPRLLLFKSDLTSLLQRSLLTQQLQRTTDQLNALKLQHYLLAQRATMSLASASSTANELSILQGFNAQGPEGLVPHLPLKPEDAAAAFERAQPSAGACCSNKAKDHRNFVKQDSAANEKHRPSTEKDREDAAFALSALAVSDRPKFTEQDQATELASLTEDERLAALSDLFGQMCSVSERQAKRSKKDLDQDSIAFLIEHMRVEIEKLPATDKAALVDAQEKCRPEEFSDARLELFLRSVGMNTRIAAERFAAYWECRRELFGPDKFFQRMTLSEALRDDLVALETGFYQILPYLDTSGRQLVLFEPRLHTGKGYSAESLLRAVWYTVEVVAEACTDISNGFIYIGWNKDSSVWDFDAKVYGRISQYEKTCWPTKFIAAHMCGASSTVSRIVRPVMKALMDRRGRSRMVIHNGAEDDILAELSEFGIQKEILPTQMGGEVVLKQSEWIAHRRAAELEEI